MKIKVNLSKRKRIMQRSKKLGHCICDPKKHCPCDVFMKKGLCPCAGERPEPTDISNIQLTKLVHNAGCASKIPASDLEALLARLPVVSDSAIISGLAAGDDAAVYKINDTTNLVQTVDVFTPCVDDPYAFGKICACNCLSDIYAMGGVPRTALSILAFPVETQDKEIMYLMLKGAMEVLQEAGCSLLGGHSIKDEEIKLGFAITGTIDTGKSVSLETAVDGDVLVLTKPIGTGVLTFANQIGRKNEMGVAAAEISMMTLNKAAAEAMIATGVSACTDITGFGLYGHLARMMRHSKTSARIFTNTLPVFEGALELLKEGVIPGANERNAEFVGEDLLAGKTVSEEYKNIGFSSETSGGLLISVPENKYKTLAAELKERNVTFAVIGEVFSGKPGVIKLDNIKGKGEEMKHQKKEEKGCCCSESDCAEAGMSAGGTSTVPASIKVFGELLASVTATGKIDKRVKELIVFSLVVLQRCESCVDLHYTKALGMGITKEELDEAAWCAILIGGAPVKMCYATFLSKRNSK